MKMALVTPQMLFSAISSDSLENEPRLVSKVKDIALIYAEYEKYFGDTLFDPRDALTRLSEELKEKDFDNFSYILVFYQTNSCGEDVTFKSADIEEQKQLITLNFKANFPKSFKKVKFKINDATNTTFLFDKVVNNAKNFTLFFLYLIVEKKNKNDINAINILANIKYKNIPLKLTSIILFSFSNN